MIGNTYIYKASASQNKYGGPLFALGYQFSGVVFWRFLFAVDLPVVGGGGPPDSSFGFV
jgi:hypothetical protein